MINYSKHGEGKTIVLLHGFCENSTCFDKQVFFLKSSYQVITPDLPGFGASEAIDNTTMDKMADEVYKVLQFEKIKECILIGHSMGGYVTLAFAKKYAHILKGFGLIHSTAYPDSEERKTKRDQAIRLIEEQGTDIYVRNFIPPLFASAFHDQECIDKLVREGLRSSPKGLMESLRAMRGREDNTSLLRETGLPVLFCIGKYDSIIPEADLFYQASLGKRSEVVYLENSAHMGYLEEPSKCSKTIHDFAEYWFEQN